MNKYASLNTLVDYVINLLYYKKLFVEIDFKP